MRWMTMAMLAVLAACGVEADVQEADATSRQLGHHQVKANFSFNMVDCDDPDWWDTKFCMGAEDPNVASSAGGNPDGHEDPTAFVNRYGTVYGLVDSEGTLYVATDEKLTDVIAIVDGVGDIEKLTVFETMDEFSERVGMVGMEISMKDGATYTSSQMLPFVAEQGYNGAESREAGGK